MKILYINHCFLVYFFIIFHASRAATHWIVTEDGKIHTQDDSVFQMRRPYDLMSLLEQEKRAELFSKIKSQLLVQKEEIETDSLSDNDDDVEQLVYLTNSDCINAGKPLIEFDLYVGMLVFAYPKPAYAVSSDGKAFSDGFPVELLHTSGLPTGGASRLSSIDSLTFNGNKHLYTIACSNTSAPQKEVDSEGGEEDDIEPVEERVIFGPKCADSLTLDFSMTSFEHLPSIRDRKQLNIDPEHEILRVIGKWKTYEEFGRDISFGLRQNSTSWILYTLASFYWRGAGNAEQAIECARRALHTSPFEYRPIPQLSLATILHRARAFEEAAVVLHGAIDITPDIPHAHYTLANIYATLADYNKSVVCYENVLKLVPEAEEVKARKAAVLCHSHIESALKAQHETLQKTLEELKDYQKQQELWINYHKKLRAEQAPPSALLEQRMHYREFKMRQKVESTLDEPLNSENVNKSPKSSSSSSTTGTSMTLDKLTEELRIPSGGKLHLKLDSAAGASLMDKIVIELDKLEKSSQSVDSLLSCEDTKKKKNNNKMKVQKKTTGDDTVACGSNIESNDSEDSSKCNTGSTGNTKQRHVPLGTNSKY